MGAEAGGTALPGGLAERGDAAGACRDIGLDAWRRSLTMEGFGLSEADSMVEGMKIMLQNGTQSTITGLQRRPTAVTRAHTCWRVNLPAREQRVSCGTERRADGFCCTCEESDHDVSQLCDNPRARA
jgi:hypothetical protein